MVVLKAVNMPFENLQVGSGIVSKQYSNLYKLLEQLQTNFGAERDEDRRVDSPLVYSRTSISQGQLSVTVDGETAFLQGIGVNTFELITQLDQVGITRVLPSAAAVYLQSRNGLVMVIDGRQSSGKVASAAL
eukprot:IDg18280t1